MRARTSNFVLDYTLRHLYIAIRNKKAALVAIRFMFRGKQWEADTPDEALRLRKELEAQDTQDWQARSMRADNVWTPDTFGNFLQAVGLQQKKAVIALFENSSLWADDLAKAIGIDEDALGGVLSGLSKQLKPLALNPSHVYQVHTDWGDGQRRRMFYLQPAFRLAAEEVGWPPKERRADAASTTKPKRK